MRSALVGAVESSAVVLRTLVRLGHPPVAVVTLPLAKAGRHSDFFDLRPIASAANVPVIEAPQLNAPEVVARLRGLALDHLFIMGWSQIARAEILACAHRGTIGLHPAPLPELRGRGVLPWTILLDRRRTAMSLFWMDEGVDSGDLLAQEPFDVDEDETAASLMAKHLAALERILDATVPALAAGAAPRRPQDHRRASWCAKRVPADGLIDWSRDGREVWTLIRAVGEPYPGAFTFAQDRPLVVWRAGWVADAPYVGLPGQVQALGEDGSVLVACRSGFVRLHVVQREGGPRVQAREVLKLHERLGLDPVALWRAVQERRP